MLFAVRRAELLTSQIAVVSRIQNRQWHSPGYFQARQKTPFELKRRAERRKLDGRRLEDSREHVLDGKRLVKASKAREYAKKALNLDPLTYVIGAVMTFGLIYIWFGYVRPWFKSSKRKVVLSLEESEVVLEEDLDVDKTKLPRPLLIVGESSPEKTALISCLLNGRESYFGWPVMHTTRKVRAREEETINSGYYFAPKAAIEQGIYSGAFVAYDNIEVGDKNISYGLSKGAIADVRLAGRICILDIDLSAAESLAQTDLYPLTLLVLTPEQLERMKRVAPVMNDTDRTGLSSFEALADARQRGFFQHEVLVKASTGNALDAACDGLVDFLKDQFKVVDGMTSA